MKKTILIALIGLMVTTPCFAQEVEPEGVFSIEGTGWKTLPIGLQILPFPFILLMDDENLGFYGDEVYLNGSNRYMENSFYADRLVCSIFSGVYRNTSMGHIGSPIWFSGIMQPIGIGMVFQLLFSGGAITLPIVQVALLIKIDNDWIPTEVE